jgi:hypothetical protein
MTKSALALLFLICGVAPALCAERPILLELFTSEGCSSCPPADQLLAELAAGGEVLALSYHVDYWDRLGWKDPFSSPAATRRQNRYARLFGLGKVYTPQLVVDGHWQAVGSDRGAVSRALVAARHGAATMPMNVMLADGTAQVRIDAGRIGMPAALLLVGFDRRHVDKVGGGENDGRTLTHVDVVRGFAEIGRWSGTPTTIAAPVPWPGERVAAILQEEDGRIIGVAAADRASSPTL